MSFRYRSPVGNFPIQKLSVAAVSMLGLAASCAPLLTAQTSKGTLVGVIRDTSGAVVPNADIKITGRADSAVREVRSKEDGSYRLEALDPESYDLIVADTGFAGYKAENVIVLASQVVSYDVKLTPGEATTTIDVQASEALLDTENGQLTGHIDSRELDRLPITSLNPYQLAITAPGAQYVRNGGFSNGNNRSRADRWPTRR